MATRAVRGLGQYSGVARAVERVGERWALLIVRDLLHGARRYSDLKQGLPRIPTNILSDRLKELQEAGIVRRVPTVRGGYELTPYGRALEPAVLALERWGISALGEPGDDEIVTADVLATMLRAAFRPAEAAALPPTEYVLHVGGASVSATVIGDRLDIVPVGPGALPQPARAVSAEPPEAILELLAEPPVFAGLLSGDGTGAGAAEIDRVSVLAGRPSFVERFTRTFHVERVGPAADGEQVAADTAVA
ncbi:helix-turn-helix domain-containing protein [Agromyces sp. LHK192]|uniref:winged helix-turn-helix transcriptional regulator n=1 Tax=Agromyces sp. LHK192 TaxID=2498704 RepID=UPI000FDB43AE|nr:helix-turn-helix domain-containing protein [Agromyces sp. LHK192]